MTRRIKQNAWDNWNGYEGSRKAVEFGTDERAAKEWAAGGLAPSDHPNRYAGAARQTTSYENATRLFAEAMFDLLNQRGVAASLPGSDWVGPWNDYCNARRRTPTQKESAAE